MKYTDKKYTCYLHFESIPMLRIEVIKFYKQLSGHGLKESKDYVDTHLSGDKLEMSLTKDEIHRIHDICLNGEWRYQIHTLLKFYFDGLITLRNEIIDEIIDEITSFQ